MLTAVWLELDKEDVVQEKKSSGVQEGDTPAFLYLISADPNRLGNDPEDQSQPSWGG